MVTLIRYVCYKCDKQSAITNAELFHVRKLQDRALRGLIWYMVNRREKARKQSLAHQTVSSVSEQLSLKSCFAALRENWNLSQVKVAQAVEFHEKHLQSKLLSVFAK